MQRIIFGCGTLLVLLAGMELAAPRIASAQDISSSNYQVLAPVIVSGGGYATSSSFSVLGVISEFSHNLSSSDSDAFNLVPGFAAYPFVSTPVVTATGVTTAVNLSWTAAVGVLGYSTASYSIGQSTASGGPYTFTAVSNVLSSTVSSLTAGTPYYFIIRAHDSYSTTIATSTEATATPTAAATTPPSSSGGGGGSSAIPVSDTGTGASFSGSAYPNSTVTVLKDAQVAATSISGSDASFQMTLSNLAAGNFIFSLYSEDNNGNRSSLVSFPLSLTQGAITNVTGIFIAPTISADKSEVRRGDTITLFGQSVPKSDIIITVHSDQSYFGTTISDKGGVYLYNFDSSILDYGSHSAQSKAMIGNQLVSGLSPAVNFQVGTKNVAATKAATCGSIGDLNCDNRVNLVDFSIMAYWYQRTLSANGLKADLNHDNKVNLTDFSILASRWTG